jgi:hypothetical protein
MPEWALQVLGMAAGAAGVYAAIRADLTRALIIAEHAAAAATEAHRRIDQHIIERGTQ